MATKIRGYKWEGNYRSYDLYYSARKNETVAYKDGECVASIDGCNGEIFELVDEKLAMMGY